MAKHARGDLDRREVLLEFEEKAPFGNPAFAFPMTGEKPGLCYGAHEPGVKTQEAGLRTHCCIQGDRAFGGILR